MRVNIQDCYDQVASLNKKFHTLLVIKGGNGHWGLYTKIEKGLFDIAVGLSTKEISLLLNGIQWALDETFNKGV